MKIKQLHLVITFATTTAAMAMERYCAQHELPGRLIPVPTAINAECGMCWRAPLEERERLTQAISALELADTQMYELLL